MPFVEFRDTTTYTTNSAGSESSSRPSRAPRPYRLSLQICLGATAIALAILLILERFTLRVLVCTVLLIGTLGALPAMLLPDAAAGTLAVFKLRFPGSLEERRVSDIRRSLDLQHASATLPPEFFEELQLPAGRGIQSVEMTRRDRPDSTHLQRTIQFETGLDERQRQTLASLMNAWFSHQILRETADQGMTFHKSLTVHPATFGGIWGKWKAKWEAALQVDSPPKGTQ